MHAPIAQAPPVHCGVALAYVHTVEQVPQWFTSVPVFCSQPLDASPSQLPYPELQASLQAPAEHEGVALAEPQTLLQLPQLLVEVRAVSQPSAVLALQSPKPALHDPIEQIELLQTPDALA